MIDIQRANEGRRVQWVQQALSQVPPGSRILDAGAGEQQFRKFCGRLRYVSQDFGQYRPENLRSGLQMATWDYGKLDIVCDITAIPEPDGSFDAVLCTEVLEHIPEPVSAIKELSRLLKGGGQLILTAPFCSLTHFAPYHFVTGFSQHWYRHHLPRFGLDVAEVTANGNFYEYLAQEVSRAPGVAHGEGKSWPTRWERWGIRMLQRYLSRMNEGTTRTSELLCFGYHVRAVKK